MIYLISPTGLVRLFGSFLLLGAVVVASLVWATGRIPAAPPTALQLAQFLSYSLAAGTLLALAVGHNRVIDLLWTVFPALGNLAPNLNGRYVFQTSSNWPLKAQMARALDGRGPKHEEGASVRPSEKQSVQGVLLVQLGLFRLRITYQPATSEPSRSSSEVLSATLRKNTDTDQFELLYVYRARVLDPKPSDEQSYYGAAQLGITSSRGRVTMMEGTYWTNRSWQNGLNTAGIAKAMRREKQHQ